MTFSFGFLSIIKWIFLPSRSGLDVVLPRDFFGVGGWWKRNEVYNCDGIWYIELVKVKQQKLN